MYEFPPDTQNYVFLLPEPSWSLQTASLICSNASSPNHMTRRAIAAFSSDKNAFEQVPLPPPGYMVLMPLCDRSQYAKFRTSHPENGQKTEPISKQPLERRGRRKKKKKPQSTPSSTAQVLQSDPASTGAAQSGQADIFSYGNMQLSDPSESKHLTRVSWLTSFVGTAVRFDQASPGFYDRYCRDKAMWWIRAVNHWGKGRNHEYTWKKVPPRDDMKGPRIPPQYEVFNRGLTWIPQRIMPLWILPRWMAMFGRAAMCDGPLFCDSINSWYETADDVRPSKSPPCPSPNTSGLTFYAARWRHLCDSQWCEQRLWNGHSHGWGL